MNLSDLNVLTSLHLVYPSAQTATFNSASVDLQQFTGVLRLGVSAGTVSGTAPTLDVKVQDSADNTTFADVAGYTLPQIVAANAGRQLGVDSRYVRRYVRLVCTIAGTTPSFTMAASLIGLPKTV